MYLDSFKEELGICLYCDALLAGDHNRHVRKEIKKHKTKVISPLGGWECCRKISLRTGRPPLES
jgi:hypothetical protein